MDEEAGGLESAPHVFVEPVDGALPGQIGISLVIPFRCRVAIESMHGARVDVAFVGDVRRTQGLIVSRPSSCQSRVELPVMHEDRRLNFGDVVCGGWTAIERRCRRKICAKPYRQRVGNSAPIAETGHRDFTGAVRPRF